MTTPQEIADLVVPEYRNGGKIYSCTGTVAKRWDAAYLAAALDEVLGPRQRL